MLRHQGRLICGVSIVILALCASLPAAAQDVVEQDAVKQEAPKKEKPKKEKAPKEKPRVKLTTDARAQATSENDTDLTVDNEGETDNQILELKAKLEANATDNLSFLIEARAVENYGQGGSVDTETGETTSTEDFVELRQYWVDYAGLMGNDGLSVRAGRQRIREDYGFWWNRDLDAVRLFHEGGIVSGFVGVGQDLTEYRSSGDRFNQDDEKIFRLFGEASWQWSMDQFVEGRFVVQDDHSGLESVGDQVRSDDFDPDDADLNWLGLRFQGAFGGEEADDDKKHAEGPSYRVDIAGVFGEEDSITTAPGAGGLRTVTGDTNTDVAGWAFDAGVDVPVPVLSAHPVFHAGYAYGSGDDDSTDGTDHAFRETGLDANSSRLGGFSSSINNYGSVLRPDLSNLHIATLGVTVPLAEATDIAGFYRYYRLAEEEGAIVGAVTGDLNGEDSDLGHGFDIVLNTNLTKQFGLEQNLVKRVNLKTTLGAFHAGDAWGDEEGETALRGQIDLGVRF